jgi:hypothetical protein
MNQAQLMSICVDVLFSLLIFNPGLHAVTLFAQLFGQGLKMLMGFFSK